MLWLSKEVLGIHRNSVKGRLIYQICYGCKRIQKFEVIGSGGGGWRGRELMVVLLDVI